ncbi:hypothetical protein B566_EDAN017534 [Ephemera danica]|nr:hypothetical protein B566_EDAN017534 [Ephemera danica]
MPVGFAILFVSILLPVLGYVYRFELIYMKQLWRMKRKNEACLIENEDSIEFDAFVSYCAADRSWVIDYLLKRLEPPLGRYNLCLHERDFQIGNYIMDNIVGNIEKSRRVIFILSNNFLKSEWCKWELRMATHRIFERSNSDFLILLKLELLRHDLVPLSLRVLLATRTYLEWHPSQSEDFWCRFKRTLGQPLSRPVQRSADEPCELFNAVDDVVENLKTLKNDPEMLEKYLKDLDTDVY